MIRFRRPAGHGGSKNDARSQPHVGATARRWTFEQGLRPPLPATDALFYALLLLGLLVGPGLIALVAGLGPLYVHEVMNLCRRSGLVLMAHIPAAGALIPLAALGVVTGLGGLALAQGVWSTRRLLRSLPAEPVSVPEQFGRLIRELDIAGQVDVIRDGWAYSFCYGLLWPRICVSTGLLALLDAAELRALLLHERHHLRRHDPLRRLISQTLARALVILPIAGELERYYRVAQEVAADRAAVQGCGSQAPLAAALAKLLTPGHTLTFPPVAVGAFSVTEARIARLVYGQEAVPRLGWAPVVASVLIVAGTVLAGYAGWMVMREPNALSTECVKAVARLR